MHRAKTNTSLDERALTEAAGEQRRTIYACGCVFDAIESEGQHAALNCPVHGSIWVEKKPLAALPEPPLDVAAYRDGLHDAKHKLFEAAGAIDALGRPDYAREFAATACSIQATLRPSSKPRPNTGRKDSMTDNVHEALLAIQSKAYLDDDEDSREQLVERLNWIYASAGAWAEIVGAEQRKGSGDGR